MRRLGILGVFLFSLSGFIPAAWACAVMAQRTDCCPDHRPCDTDRIPVSASLGNATCCNAQAPTRTVGSISVQKKDAHTAAPYPNRWPNHWPDHWPDQWAGLAGIHAPSARTQRMRAPVTFDPRSGTDQQQLYLQTGRLRL
jgi:hypothetical protein